MPLSDDEALLLAFRAELGDTRPTTSSPKTPTRAKETKEKWLAGPAPAQPTAFISSLTLAQRAIGQADSRVEGDGVGARGYAVPAPP